VLLILPKGFLKRRLPHRGSVLRCGLAFPHVSMARGARVYVCYNTCLRGETSELRYAGLQVEVTCDPISLKREAFKIPSQCSLFIFSHYQCYCICIEWSLQGPGASMFFPSVLLQTVSVLSDFRSVLYCCASHRCAQGLPDGKAACSHSLRIARNSTSSWMDRGRSLLQDWSLL
jgi:hypothetical protein